MVRDKLGLCYSPVPFKDHAVVFVAQPKPGLSKVVELRAHGPHKPSLLGQTVDAGRSNHVGSSCSRKLNSVAVVHQLRLRREFRSEDDGFAFARVQAGLEKPFCFRGVGNLLHGEPRSHRSLDRVGDRQTCSADRDLPKNGPGDDDFAEKGAKHFKIAGQSAARYTRGLVLETTKGYPILRRLSNSSMALASASQSSAV